MLPACRVDRDRDARAVRGAGPGVPVRVRRRLGRPALRGGVRPVRERPVREHRGVHERELRPLHVRVRDRLGRGPLRGGDQPLPAGTARTAFSLPFRRPSLPFAALSPSFTAFHRGSAATAGC